MGKTKSLLRIAVLIAAFAAGFGQAVAGQHINVRQTDFANPAFAQAGVRPTSIPVGAADFCKSHASDCQPYRQVVQAMPLSPALWQQLLEVNAKYNQQIVARTDEELYKTIEFWTYPNGYGDCEDYALAKRRELISLGWPASTLLMTVVRKPDGEGHAVLMVRTDRGDLVLDNLEGLIKVWKDTPYKYLKRQSQRGLATWVDIYDNRPVRVASR